MQEFSLMSELKPEESSGYLVIGGELQDFTCQKFLNAENMEIVGIFADYEQAEKAWKSRALETVDNALRRYCIIDIDAALEQAQKLSL